MKITLYLGLVALILIGCCRNFDAPSSPTSDVSQDSTIYRSAVQDAMYPEESKVFDNLVAITKDNKELIWKTGNGGHFLYQGMLHVVAKNSFGLSICCFGLVQVHLVLLNPIFFLPLVDLEHGLKKRE